MRIKNIDCKEIKWLVAKTNDNQISWKSYPEVNVEYNTFVSSMGHVFKVSLFLRKPKYTIAGKWCDNYWGERLENAISMSGVEVVYGQKGISSNKYESSVKLYQKNRKKIIIVTQRKNSKHLSHEEQMKRSEERRKRKELSLRKEESVQKTIEKQHLPKEIKQDRNEKRMRL